ncbi:hypothetical protein CBF23_002165 [Marinomonas agarivorans]|nr:hypothetical protein CBF23_002165 [Marinomonas agarivorans]
MHKIKESHIPCYWSGKLQLTNGEIHPMHCIQISEDSIEIETPTGLKGCKKSLLVIDAINHSDMETIKAICIPKTDILNEFDKHYITFNFEKISDQNKRFIKRYIKDNT